jgi:hypothetical protein
MKYTFVPYKDLKPEIWSNLVNQAHANLNYEPYFIEYQILSYKLENLSGVVFFGSTPVAIYVVYLEAKSNSISSYSLPPIFLTESNLDKEKSNKLYSDINKLFDGLHEYVISNNRLISWIPATQIQNKKESQGESVLELIINLNDSYDNLYERLARNHKRTIKRSIDMGQTIVQMDSNSSKYLISSLFLAYMEQHIMAAGRDRRPDESYEYMEKLIRLGISKLFVSMYKNEPISYLYCDSRRAFARGWSQVTNLNLEKNIFPRTLLEWSAIKAYKAEGKSIYHLGSRTQSYTSGKILGFEEFKRRFNPIEIS